MSGRTVRWLLSLRHRARSHGGGPRLTIVRHHRVYGVDERPLYRLGVAEDVFAAQLDLLVHVGLTPVTVAEGLAFLAAGAPGHRVAMSFDDGYADNVTRALPLLEERGARATFYLTAGWIERRAPAWWDVLAHALESTRVPRARVALDDAPLDLELDSEAGRRRALGALLPRFSVATAERARRLDALRAALAVEGEAPCELADWKTARRLVDAGMEVGAHTLEHPLLTRLARPEQEREIAGSIEQIEQRLGTRPVGLAYPGGDHDGTTIAAARAAGLDYAVTTRAGDNGAGTPRFELRRRGLSEGACLGPAGRFSRRLALAELDGAFDRLRGVEVSP